MTMSLTLVPFCNWFTKSLPLQLLGLVYQLPLHRCVCPWLSEPFGLLALPPASAFLDLLDLLPCCGGGGDTIAGSAATLGQGTLH